MESSLLDCRGIVKFSDLVFAYSRVLI